MVHQTRIRPYVHIRATQKGGGIYGIARMGSTQNEGITPIEGICAEFSSSQDFKNLDFKTDSQDLFFYGNEKVFRLNYRSNSMADSKIHLLEEHTESEYSARNKMADYKIFAKIPLRLMDLSTGQLDVISRISRIASHFLKEGSQTLERKEVPSEEDVSLKSYKGSSKRFFPSNLFELIEDNGFYLDARLTLKHSDIQGATFGKLVNLGFSPQVSSNPYHNKRLFSKG